jgi:hypothetical protein
MIILLALIVVGTVITGLISFLFFIWDKDSELIVPKSVDARPGRIINGLKHIKVIYE